MSNVNELRCPFKHLKSLEERKIESKKIRKKYPDRIPVIVEKNENSDIKEIDKNKYLVPSDLSFSQFVYIIRKRIQLHKSQALFLFVNNKLVPSNKSVTEVYDSEKDEDGFLYVIYNNENTFG